MKARRPMANEASKLSPADAYYTMLKVVYDMLSILRNDIYDNDLIKEITKN
jgi:hypothetical protein